MFEVAPRPLLPPRRFAARMVAILLNALFVNGVVLAAGAIGYHSLEGLDWLDASLNAALVMTGNGPVHPPHTPEGKLFTVFYALLGVILFAAVIGVLLTPLLHRMLHEFHSHHLDHGEKNEEQTVGAGQHHSESEGGRT